jgi:hypothetical protein
VGWREYTDIVTLHELMQQSNAAIPLPLRVVAGRFFACGCRHSFLSRSVTQLLLCHRAAAGPGGDEMNLGFD